MNYCMNCGNKLEDGANFCNKCGSATDLGMQKVNEEIHEKKEKKQEKLLLIIGTILVIVASGIFALATWNEMSSIFKVLFLAIESLLFLSISLFSKKVNDKLPYKTLWFIGITFIPLIMHLIAYDEMLGHEFSYSGNNLYVYLSICAFICTILYFISFKLLKTKIFIYITYLFGYLTLIFIPSIFKLDDINGIDYLFPIITLLNLIIVSFYSFIKNETYNRTLNIFISIATFICTIIAYIYIYNNCGTLLLNILVLVINLIISLLVIFKSNKNIMVYLHPFAISILTCAGIYSLLDNYSNISPLIIVLSIILINFIIHFKDNIGLKVTSYVVTIISVLITLLSLEVGDRTLTICYAIILAALIFTICLKSEKSEVVMSKLILPFSIYLFASSLINSFVNMDISIVYLIVSILCFTIYILLYQKVHDKLFEIIFEIASYIFLGISSILIIANYVGTFAFILNEIVWLYYFIFNSIVKKNTAVNITLLSLLIINFILCASRYSINFVYSILFITILTSVLDFIRTTINNKKSIYVYFAVAASSIGILYGLYDVSIIGVCLSVLSYIFTYYLLIKKHQAHFSVKYIFTIFGFILIYSLYHYFINIDDIANMLTLVTYIIVIVSMFLLRVDSDRKVLSYSIITAIPYFELINQTEIFSDYIVSLTVLFIIAMLLIYFEKVFKINETARMIIELVVISLLHLFTIFDMVIFDFVLAAFYIFFGFYKKRDGFVLLGTILIILNLFLNIFEIANNVSITYILLLIGLLMLGYVFYLEARKKNRK